MSITCITRRKLPYDLINVLDARRGFRHFDQIVWRKVFYISWIVGELYTSHFVDGDNMVCGKKSGSLKAARAEGDHAPPPESTEVTGHRSRNVSPSLSERCRT